MADKIDIVYFLEDRTQQDFIKALVVKIAREIDIRPDMIAHIILSARKGSKVVAEFKNFLTDIRNKQIRGGDIIIISKDGNCKGFNEGKKELERHVRPEDPFRSRIIYAIPDPHIERWYMLDRDALCQATGITAAPEPPSYKCDKNYYKNLLKKALRDSNIYSLLGGAEYADGIVQKVSNIDATALTEPSLNDFVSKLRAALRCCRISD